MQSHFHVLGLESLGVQLRQSRYPSASFLGKEVAP